MRLFKICGVKLMLGNLVFPLFSRDLKLVGEASGDIADDYDEVTVNSPMGEALMKARIGETVRVNTPRGVKRFEVVEIL